MVSGPPKDPSAERLRRLAEEVSRLASTLARLAMNTGAERADRDPQNAAGQPDVALELVSSVIRTRRRRRDHFRKELFSDPAWDMMLHLLEAEMLQRPVAISSLGAAAAVPPTTAQRWVKTLLHHGLIIRRPHPIHLGQIYVELSPATSAALRDCLSEFHVRGGPSL
jgi:DNA-binding MarR family transcriptional regulator